MCYLLLNAVVHPTIPVQCADLELLSAEPLGFSLLGSPAFTNRDSTLSASARATFFVLAELLYSLLLEPRVECLELVVEKGGIVPTFVLAARHFATLEIIRSVLPRQSSLSRICFLGLCGRVRDDATADNIGACGW